MKISKSMVALAAVIGIAMAQPVTADDNAETFKKLDVDGDGFITKQEAEVNDDLVDSFDDGDNNDDGQLDMAEFAKLDVTDE
jgi:Ca2+-binding EF-hand superfamily protein